MDALKYLDTIVDPTIAEFEKQPTCFRRAFLACVATFHTVDYLATPKNSAQILRRRFCEESQEFLLIDRAAHAFKHVKSGHDDSLLKPTLFVSNIASRPPAILGRMILGLSRLGDAIGGVATASGHGKDLLPTVKRAAAFLRRKAVGSTQL